MTHTSAPTPTKRARPWALARLASVPLALALLTGLPAEAQREPEAHRSRLRVGVSAVGGGFAGSTQGALGGLSPRVGVQLDDSCAIYLQGQWLLGEFLREPGRGTAGFVFHALMFDLTVGDVLQLGGGPSLDYVFGCADPDQRACTGRGPYLGADLRVAVLAGYRRPFGRAGPTFSLDLHPTWLGDDLFVTMLIGIGYEVS